MLRSLKKLAQKNGVKTGKNGENLHKAIYINLHKENLLLPTQGLFKWGIMFWITQKLGHFFKGTSEPLLLDATKTHPPKGIFSHPGPTIATRSHSQSARIYLELAVTFIFQKIFASIDKIFSSGEGGVNERCAIILWRFDIFVLFPNFLRSEVLSFSATHETIRICQFIINKHASFHLWWKKNLLNHQKVSKYYEHDCLQNFVLLFMSLLTTFIVKNSHVLIGIYVIFLKKVLDQTWKAFNTKFEH